MSLLLFLIGGPLTVTYPPFIGTFDPSSFAAQQTTADIFDFDPNAARTSQTTPDMTDFDPPNPKGAA